MTAASRQGTYRIQFSMGDHSRTIPAKYC